uniref:Uncharacterized protein n=1 Tax=Daphnia galeata TaxID=27404 RepID=A0A8J2RB19_9CRUS|nr:unnamed protein product [Daphnia galeata]
MPKRSAGPHEENPALTVYVKRNCTSMAKSRNASGTKQTTAPVNDGNVSCLTQKVIPHFLSWVYSTSVKEEKIPNIALTSLPMVDSELFPVEFD